MKLPFPSNVSQNLSEAKTLFCIIVCGEVPCDLIYYLRPVSSISKSRIYCKSYFTAHGSNAQTIMRKSAKNTSAFALSATSYFARKLTKVRPSRSRRTHSVSLHSLLLSLFLIIMYAGADNSHDCLGGRETKIFRR